MEKDDILAKGNDALKAKKEREEAKRRKRANYVTYKLYAASPCVKHRKLHYIGAVCRFAGVRKEQGIHQRMFMVLPQDSGDMKI